MTNDPSTSTLRKPVDLIAERIVTASINEKCNQTAFAIIGALEQNGWVIVRKRHMRVPK